MTAGRPTLVLLAQFIVEHQEEIEAIPSPEVQEAMVLFRAGVQKLTEFVESFRSDS